MLGNIRFVGALLARNMLASKVLLAILEELLAEPTPEALESLAVLLVQIGPIFDTPQWTYHAALKGYFDQVKAIIAKDDCPNRIRCLLQDVLDLRASSWEDRKPKRVEGPMKLNDVAKKAAADQQGGQQQQGKGKKENGTKSPTHAQQGQRTPLALKPPSAKISSAKTTLKAAPDTPKKKNNPAQFEETTYRAEMQKTFAELRVSHDAAEAIARLTAAGVPPAARQAALLCDMLVIIVEEANCKMRKASFAAVAGLFLTGAWGAEALTEGVHSFLGEACDDLRLDVPALPQILGKELKPQFLEPLTQKGMLQEAGFEMYLK
jgi:translation initiation factor 4G